MVYSLRQWCRCAAIVSVFGLAVSHVAGSVVVTQTEGRAFSSLWLKSKDLQQREAHQLIANAHEIRDVPVFDDASLADADVVYLSPSLDELRLSVAEIDALERYAESGGRLIIAADNGVWATEFAEIAARFEVEYGDTFFDGLRTGVVSEYSTTVTRGRAGVIGSFTAASTNDRLSSTNDEFQVLATWADGSNALGLVPVGDGEVIFLTDFNTFDGDMINDLDNRDLWQNLFERDLVQAGDLLVSSRLSDEILLYDGENGDPITSFASDGGLDNPVGLTFGPDGNLYVSSAETQQILRYDASNGALIDVFASDPQLTAPRQINFGPDGNLYIGNGGTNTVLAFDGDTGDFVRIAAQGNGLNGPTSFTFGPDGNLYVGSVISNKVLRFDGQTGDFIDVFASQSLSGPHDLSFGIDGDLYVSNAFTPNIIRFDGKTGSFDRIFISDPALQFALGLSWDDQGLLYVCNQGGNEVRRYNAFTGDFFDIFVQPGSGGVDGPLFGILTPRSSTPTATPLMPGFAGEHSIFAIHGAQPGGRSVMVYGTRAGDRSVPGCSGLTIGIKNPVVVMDGIADESGSLIARRFLPGNTRGMWIGLQGIDRSACKVTNIAVQKIR